jgi:nitrogen fixation/metabolism regulation signal transduction histidine kinase
MLSFFIFAVLGSILYAAIFSMLTADSLTIVYKDNNLTIGKTPYILMAEMMKANWILILSGGVVGVIIAMFLTHRFAGPVFKLERAVREMAAGNLLADVRLRKGDEGKELAATINLLKETLTSNVKSMRELSAAMDDSIRKAAGAGGREELGPILAGAEEINAKLKKILDGYITDKK